MSKIGSREVFKKSDLRAKRNTVKPVIAELKESKIEIPFSWDAGCRL